MQEFDSIKVSTYEAEKLTQQLTERSAEGWAVVSIVGAGSDIIAYLSRAAGTATAATTAAASAADTGWGGGTTAAEPAGWGSAPAEQAAAASTEPAGGWGATSTGGSGTSDAGEWGVADSGAGAGAAAAGTGQGGGTPAVPPGWFNDPAGRFDLRYWDGNQWTEHVTRGGQQYTDPPVA